MKGKLTKLEREVQAQLCSEGTSKRESTWAVHSFFSGSQKATPHNSVAGIEEEYGISNVKISPKGLYMLQILFPHWWLLLERFETIRRLRLNHVRIKLHVKVGASQTRKQHDFFMIVKIFHLKRSSVILKV